MAAFLGVENSFSGRRWIARAGEDGETERLGLAISQRLGLPEVVGRVMAARGVGLDEAELFIRPSLRDQMPDPSKFQGMDEAAERICGAIEAGETIGVFGDYDVDGATSTAVLGRFFDAVGVKWISHIPDRRTEGYGPNLPALLGLKDRGAGLVLTVDCGITAFEPLAGAADAGLDTIIVDHHVAEPALPRAVAVINPNRLDDDSGFGYLAAVGVSYMLVVAVNRALRAKGWYEGRREPNLLQWLDMVALGTVCDVVPLIGLNRAFVTQGLKIMGQRGNTGLNALSEVARLDSKPGPYHLGFLLGPRVNAGGRVGKADLGARLLSGDDPAIASGLAKELDEFNTERKEIEAGVLAQAVEQAEAMGKDTPFLLVASEDWHEGVIGIVAGRLRERFNRPACVVSLEGGIGKGSGRSVPGVDLGAAIIAAHQQGLLEKGGGHAMAAGFSVKAENLKAFQEFMSDRVRAQLEDQPLVASINLDGAVTIGGAGLDLLDALDMVGPFGSGNSEPRFAFPAVSIVKADVVGQNHVRCVFASGDGKRLKGIAFRAMDSDLGPALLKSGGAKLHVSGHLRRDDWQGRSGVQLFIDDAAPVS